MTAKTRKIGVTPPVPVPTAASSPAAPTTLDRENPIVVMKRYELKYLLTGEQKDFLTENLQGRMRPDQFGKTSVASLYYDTPDYRLIRASVEKPEFKEKIRLRSYGPATEESPVFLELKRKAEGVVYKRRVKTTIPRANGFFAGTEDVCAGGQINREITAFRDFYETLVPACLIVYDRTAYFEPDGDLRLTVDEAPRYRTARLRLDDGMDGIPLLGEGGAILEIKVQTALPLWLAAVLGEGRIYQTGFSKYGEAYRQQLLKSNRNERTYRYV